MSGTTAIAYEKYIAPLYENWVAVEEKLAQSGIDIGLAHLVKLRASQMNGCGFCVKMHTAEARRDGETDERLDRLVVWRHVDDFTPAEKAAFAWTEALTVLEDGRDYEALRLALLEHYSEKEITMLTGIISMINLWNRIQVSRH